MTVSDVLWIINRLKANGISAWIDGGWGVDALLEEQTREHADLDIAVHRKDNAKLRELLTADGYTEARRDDSSEYMYVLKNEAGQQIDVHVFEHDENGGNVYGIEYPFTSLTGKGKIDGQTVNCISPEWMFRFKTGYKPKVKDIQDARALAAKFGFELPEGYSNEVAEAEEKLSFIIEKDLPSKIID